MSNAANDRYIETLFERLERLSPDLTLPDYADKQKQLLQMIIHGQLDDANEAVLKWEEGHLGAALDKAELSYDL